MALVAESISTLVTIKLKARHDGITDQYSRLFMLKISVLFGALTGFNYFKDKVTCIVANANGMGGGFVSSVCWIQGFYVYKEMGTRLSESAYYGIPNNMDYDGLDAFGELCSTVSRSLDREPSCTPMTKVYYLQYQYFPFVIASFSLLFYLPYIAFTRVNTDMFSLKELLDKDDVTAEMIVKGYFDRKLNTLKSMRYKIISNILIKIFYIIINVLALLICDAILNNHFVSYGTEYVDWTQKENEVMHSHDLKFQEIPKPGNVLLPAMGFCDVYEASRDLRNTHINSHKFICEISQHVLYQYVLIVYWFLLVIGIFLSILGLIMHLFVHLGNFFTVNRNDSTRTVSKRITTRESEYLEYMRQKNRFLYHEVIIQLQESGWLPKYKENDRLWADNDKL